MITLQETKPLAAWADSLPHEWRLCRLKSVASIRYGLGQPPAELPSGVAMIRATDVDAGTIRTDNFLRVDPAELPPGRNPYLKAGEIIVVRSGAYTGDSAIVPSALEGAVAGYDMVATVTRASSHFVAYSLLSKHVLEDQIYLLTLRAAQPHLNAEELGSVVLAMPPTRHEQQRIAAYLDASCAAIDAAVAAKRRQLEILDALRKSTIKRAVTMGMNPSVKTQRTDVEWIPEMPQHWRLVRIKDAMEFFNTVRVPLSAAERGVMTEKTYDYYGASGVIDKVEAYLFDGTYILIAEDGANLLTRSKPLAFLATGQFWVNNHAHILKPRWGGDETFFVTLLESQNFSLFVTGAAQPKLTMANLGRFKLAVPRVAEQKAIAAFIREKDAEFHPLFAQIERQIATLTAYRKSLIHECVTGQRRISEADVARSQLSENTGQLKLEPSERNGRLKTNRADDRKCYADLGKALKGGGQFGSPLAFKFATADED
jgi:type I restriction enzyme S subunit